MTQNPSNEQSFQIVQAKQDQNEQIANLFAQVFTDDPTWTAIVPNKKRRRTVIEKSFKSELDRGGYKNVLVACDKSGNVLGALRFFTPESVSADPTFWKRAIEAVASAVDPSTRRGIKHDTAVLSKRPSEPHWYFRDIVISPNAQGRGIGSALLKHQLELVDENPVPVFLESTTEGSKRLYERFGFVWKDSVSAIPGATVFIMIRPA